VQHNRELEEQARHHAVALKEAQALYAQRYETFSKQLDTALADQSQELEAKHTRALKDEENRHREILHDEIQELSKQLAMANDQEAALYKQIEELSAGTDASEQGQLDELMQAQRELAQRDAEHETQLQRVTEALNEKHALSLQALQDEITVLNSDREDLSKLARNETAEGQEAEKRMLEEALAQQTTAQEAVLRKALEELAGQHTTEKQALEDALTQLKASHEKQLQSSLNEASERHAAERQFLEQALSERETEHAEALKAALDRQRAELTEQHRNETPRSLQTVTETRPPTAETQPGSPSASARPILSPSATFRRPKRLSITRGSSSSGLTLEGTLESIRLQTEQLLELNDDFIAERRRWSSRLSGARSSSAATEGQSNLKTNGIDAPASPSVVKAAS
jgi:hypothetical protein